MKEKTSHLLSLDGIRGLAALMVFFYHARWTGGEPEMQIAGFDILQFLRGWDSGVCLFFILSGFLLVRPFFKHILWEEKPVRLEGYFLRRFARIMPAYYLVLFVFIPFNHMTYTLYSVLSSVLQFLGLHTFYDDGYSGVVPVLWSIGIEWQYYLLLPFLMLLGALAYHFGRFPLLVFFLSIALYFAGDLWQCLLRPLAPYIPNRFVRDDLARSMVFNASVFQYLKWFAGGILFSLLDMSFFTHPRKKFCIASWVWNVFFIFSALASIAVVYYSGEGTWRNFSTFGWPLNVFVFACFILSATKSSIAAVFFENKIARFMGAISYGVYLWHYPLLKAVYAGTFPGLVKRMFPGHMGEVLSFVLLSGLALILTCAIASLSFYFLEKKVLRLAHEAKTFRGFFQRVRKSF